jgi:hypothetical protein
MLPGVFHAARRDKPFGASPSALSRPVTLELASLPPVCCPGALAPSLARKPWHKLRMELRSVLYLVGLKKPCQDFRNVEVVDKQEA